MESFNELLSFQKEIASSKEFAKNKLLFQRWTVKTKVGRLTDERLRCFDCQYPPCSNCSQRPIHAIMHNAMHEGKYFCFPCKFPPCQVCHTAQPSKNILAKRMFQAYTCKSCKPHAKGDEKECQNCKTSFAKSTGMLVDNHDYCSESCAFPSCANPECEQPRPANNQKKYVFHHKPVWHCTSCQKYADRAEKQCQNCKTSLASITGVFIDNHHYCSKSCAYPSCANPKCKHPRPSNNQKYYVFHNKPVWRCTSCQSHGYRAEETSGNPECHNCKTSCASSTAMLIDDHHYCSHSCAYPTCAKPKCKQERPANHQKKYVFHNKPVWHCQTHKGYKTK